MSPDGNCPTICSLELNPNKSTLHEVETSKHVVPNGKNGASMIRKLLFKRHVNRLVSDVSTELRRRSMNSYMNLHVETNLEVEQAQCEWCGMFEECTSSYISRVREIFSGNWICGLYAEVVKEEHHQMGRVVQCCSDVGGGANEATNKSSAMKLPTSACLCISPLVGASSLFGCFPLVWVFHRLGEHDKNGTRCWSVTDKHREKRKP
jgi:hypothetical protein